jgi:hypothetical protein
LRLFPSIRPFRLDLGAITGLFLLAGCFASLSWRKWPDPLVDFGREVYTPWRIANGAVLYRDIEGLFGPLSQYFNATLFKLFGPGLMVLVWANLLIIAGIIVALYALCRRAWERPAATVATAAFVAVFGFTQLVIISNYNFVTPYAHETTHGFLVLLLLALALLRWMEQPTERRSFAAGLLLGLTAVLKPEPLLAAGVATAAAWVLLIRARRESPLRFEHGVTRMIAWWLFGTALPTLLFTLFFLRLMPLVAAFRAAGNAWLAVFHSNGLNSNRLQMEFLGLDKPAENLLRLADSTATALLTLGILAAAAWGVGRGTGGSGQRSALTQNTKQIKKSPRAKVHGSARSKPNRTKRFRVSPPAWIGAALVVFAAAWFALTRVEWIQIGQCLPGLAVIYLAFRLVLLARHKGRIPMDQRSIARLLIALMAMMMILRMGLNGRIYHYGFCQAALAGVLLVGALIGEAPEWLASMRGGDVARRVFLAAAIVLLFVGAAKIADASREIYQAKTFSVGSGRDLFYSFPRQMNSSGALVQWASSQLRQLPDDQTAIALPEGIMINYLARKKSPIPLLYYFSNTTEGGKEAAVVRQLEQHPPDWIAVVSRDLREHGIVRYGEASGKGQDILQWINRDYKTASAMGGNPFDLAQGGALILRRR